MLKCLFMKQTLSFSLAALLILGALIPSSHAAEIAPEGTIRRKLQRGFLNIALSPFEISHEIVNTQKYDTALPTWIAGFVKGTAKTGSRMLVGAYEIVTSPIPLPGQYAPVLQPEFPWDLLDNKSRPVTPAKAS